MYVPSLSGWHSPGAVERAFQLAESGDCRSISDIQRELNNEHYDDVFDHLAGQLIRQQLNRVIAEARCRPAQTEAGDRSHRTIAEAIGANPEIRRHALAASGRCPSTQGTPLSAAAEALRKEGMATTGQ